ncbi:MAG: nucleotide exchange factor GrpE, partial [Frankiaceae bacterium]|nr:nucleotide exchange factor GrpE [Frankiaceae bacterium]
MSRPDEEGWDLDPDRVVVRDKRRLDPDTGEVRAGAAAPSSAQEQPGEQEQPAPAEPDRSAELTADLQRISAEYANYRKRVERARVAGGALGPAGGLSGLRALLAAV